MVLLITGGSGSGKSEYAELRTQQLGHKNGGRMIYIATMEPFGEEGEKRIERHRAMRKDKHFETVECYTHLEQLCLLPTDTVLLECLSNLTANEMYSERGRKSKVSEVILMGVEKMADTVANLVIVGNNVFDDGITYDASTQEYIRQLAEVQNRMAGRADEVVEVVCGIPLILKGRER